MAVKPNDLAVKTLKPKTYEYEIGVLGHRGLVVRVHPSGRRGYIYRFRQDGVLKRVALQSTSLSQARIEWDALAAKVKLGQDPAESVKREKAVQQLKRQADRADPDFASLAADFVRLHAKRHKKSWRADELMLTKLAVPEWGQIKAREIHRRDVIALLDKVAAKTPVRANRLLAVVRKMFNWAVDRGVVETSPCARLKRPGKERSRERVLSDAELKTFWNALPASTLPADTQAALKLQLLTGCRIGEIAAANWSEIDLDKGEWLIPGRRAKNGLENLVPLTKDAVELLQGLPKSERFVFPRRGKKSGHLRVDAVTHELREANFGIKERFTSHDLRRTVATNLGRLNVSRVVQDGLLNHKDRTMGAVYDRYRYAEAKRAALDAWALLLQTIADKNGRENVVPIRTKTAA